MKHNRNPIYDAKLMPALHMRKEGKAASAIAATLGGSTSGWGRRFRRYKHLTPAPKVQRPEGWSRPDAVRNDHFGHGEDLAAEAGRAGGGWINLRVPSDGGALRIPVRAPEASIYGSSAAPCAGF